MHWNTIDTYIQNHSLLKHPLYTAWSHGELTQADLRFYAEQYYAIEKRIPCWLASILAGCEHHKDDKTIKIILENLNEETLGEENHRELWLRFAEGLGSTREAVVGAPPHPKTQACIDVFKTLAANTDPAVGLGAFYAYESQLPEISQSKIEGLARFYGIQDARTLQFFEVHKTADVWHAEQEKTAIEYLQASTDTVLESVKKACAALWTFLDGVYEATVLQRAAVAQ